MSTRSFSRRLRLVGPIPERSARFSCVPPFQLAQHTNELACGKLSMRTGRNKFTFVDCSHFLFNTYAVLSRAHNRNVAMFNGTMRVQREALIPMLCIPS